MNGKSDLLRSRAISPLLSNVYFTEVDRNLERAKAVTRQPARSSAKRCVFDVCPLSGWIACVRRHRPHLLMGNLSNQMLGLLPHDDRVFVDEAHGRRLAERAC
jgi:hypothetical protein